MARGEEPRKNNKEASRGWEDDPGECSRARGWVKEMDACLVEKHLQEGEGYRGKVERWLLRYDLLSKSNRSNIPC